MVTKKSKTEMNYMTYGIVFGPGIGMILGMIFGSATDGDIGKALTMGLIFGAAFGIIIGSILDQNSKKKKK